MEFLVFFFVIVVPICLGIQDARRGDVPVEQARPEPEQRIIVL